SQVNPGLYVSGPVVTRRYDRMRFPGEELVVVTAPMFHHKIAKGYADPVGRVVQEVNGTKIKNLRHVVEVLRDATDEFLTFGVAEVPDSTGRPGRRISPKATRHALSETRRVGRNGSAVNAQEAGID